MSGERNEIPERSMMTAEAAEMRRMIVEGVDARRGRGYERAVEEVAREVEIKPRRVLALLRRELHDVWASELRRAERWYGEFCRKELARAEHRALLQRAGRVQADIRDAKDGLR